MADINALPKEILDHMISFMDDNTKRVSRLASTQWFKQIRYADFQLNHVQDDQLEAVTTRLSQYDMPISVEFENRMRQLAKIVDPLTKLTNLTSLNLGALERPTDLSDWLKLTCLTNLTYLARVRAREPPMELCLHLTGLRCFVEYPELPVEDARRMVQCLTNLEYLHFRVAEVPDAFELVKSLSHLTLLYQFHDGCKTINEENTKSLANLKHLTWNAGYDGDEEMSLRYMTALENLATCVPFHSINSTRLVHVSVQERAIASLVQNYSKLYQLKALSVRFNDQTDIKAFEATMTSFTALEGLDLEWHEGCDIIYNLVTSTNLTVLELYSWNLAVPIKLTSIEFLILHDDSGEIDYSALSNLINLTRLQISSRDVVGQNSLPTTLANIKVLEWNMNVEMNDFRSFTNLEHLQLLLSKEDQLNGLEYATRLTYLSLFSNTNEVVDCGFLKNMTLMENIDIGSVICQNLWQHMSRLKNLRSLTVPRLEREQEVLSLTNMTNLRYLRTTAQYVKGVYLTLLTSLQTLHFVSDAAAQAISVDKLYSALTRLSYHTFQ